MRRALACVLLFASCSAPVPTQLVVVVDSDLAPPVEIDRIWLSVAGPTDSAAFDRTERLSGPADLPLTLGLSPGSDALGPVTIRASAELGPVEVATLSVRSAFVRSETRVVRVDLLRVCSPPLACPRGETCGEDRRCVSDEVPVADLGAWTGDAGRLGVSPPLDAGGIDGGTDAGIDAAPDAMSDAEPVDARSDAGGCRTDDACGVAEPGVWRGCVFPGTCDTVGTDSREVRTPVCSAGVCGSSTSTESRACSRPSQEHVICADRSRCCGGTCVDIYSSTQHCGGCGLACAPGQSCGLLFVLAACTCVGNSDCASTHLCSATDHLCSCQSDMGLPGVCPAPFTCHPHMPGADICTY